MPHVGPFSEIRLCDFLRSGNSKSGSASALPFTSCSSEVLRDRESIQFLPPLKMFVVVEEIGPPFSPCAVVYAAVFARLGRFGLAEGAGKRFRGGFFFSWRFGGWGG